MIAASAIVAHVVLAGERVEHVVVVVEVLGAERLANRVDGLSSICRARRSATVGTFSIAICCLVSRSMLASSRCSRGSASVIATPSPSGPPDAPDAVHVALGGRRHVVVDDVGERVDVEPASGDVGGHQQLGGAVAQPAHHAVALRLVHAAVQRLGAVAAAVHRLGELVDLGACAAEHERRRRRLDVEDAAERRRLVRALHDVGALADSALPGLGVAAADLDPDRIALVALGDAR